MNDIRSRIRKNSGTILNEGFADEKLAELEIKDRATRVINNFQREVLSIAQYIDNGCSYSYSCDNSNKEKISEENKEKFRKIVLSMLMGKVGTFPEFIKASFEEKEEESKIEVAIASPVGETPASPVVNVVKDLFGY